MKAPKQADHQSQELLQSIVKDKKSEIILSSGRKVKIGWIKSDTQDKIDDIIVHHDTIAKEVKDEKMSVQEGNRHTRKFFAHMVAAILINNYIGLKLYWWLKWRIIYHFWDINGNDYASIIAEAKKKATEQEYLLAMAYSMTMADIWTTMTKKETEVFLQELNLAKEQQQ